MTTTRHFLGSSPGPELMVETTRSVPSMPEQRSPRISLSAADGSSTSELQQQSDNIPSTEDGTLRHYATKLRRHLVWHFMDPVSKWRARHQIPWKLTLQVIKIFVVTLQLVLFASLRQSQVVYIQETETVLRHLLLKDWDPSKDVDVYPPSTGPFSVYSKGQLYENIGHAIWQYYNINHTSFSNLQQLRPREAQAARMKNSAHQHYPSIQVTIEQFMEAHRFPNWTLSFNTDKETIVSELELGRKEVEELGNATEAKDTNMIIQLLAKHDIRLDPLKLLTLQIKFDLTTVVVKIETPFQDVNCFIMTVHIVYDNSEQTGRVKITLKAIVDYLTLCDTDIHRTGSYVVMMGYMALDIIVLLVCLGSFLLCTRALLNAQVLRLKTQRYFAIACGERLTFSDKCEFLNLWYLTIVINDVFIVIGTIFKMSTEFQFFDNTLFTATGILLGTGNLLVWVGVLRYLGFFPTYNVLILTIRRSMPNMLRFLLCAGLLYCGFLFCGWVVIGPYSMKFRTLASSSEALFSLINGDDMFATYYSISEGNHAVKIFGRIYVYVFVALFIYVVLSLFISIIMDAYEVVKERLEPQSASSSLQKFITEEDVTSYLTSDAELSTSNESASNRRLPGCTWCHGLISWLNIARPSQQYGPIDEHMATPSANEIRRGYGTVNT